jgi:hypothetical protein
VTVEGIVDEHMRRIGMLLGSHDYSNAVQAHDHRLKVKCKGELTKMGRGYHLESPRHFEVIPEEDSD